VTMSPAVIIDVHFVEVYALYPRVVISSPFDDLKTSMLPCPLKHKHIGVWPGDHYMPLQKFTPGSIQRCQGSPLKVTLVVQSRVHEIPCLHYAIPST
jgi:hypothetical protein